jgi:hypothetical protein
MGRIFLTIILVLCFNLSYAADYYTAATARTQVRSLIGESSASFWTDTELDNWIKEGTEIISSRALCLQDTDTFLLVTSQYEYTDLVTNGAAGVTDIVKVWGAIYLNPDDEYIGLKRVEPFQISNLPLMKAGPPKYYYHFDDKIGILPLPTSGQNGDSVKIYFSKQSQTIGDLPNEYQALTIWFCASQAYKKEHRYTESDKFYQMFLEELNALKLELYGAKIEQKTP